MVLLLTQKEPRRVPSGSIRPETKQLQKEVEEVDLPVGEGFDADAEADA